MHELSMAQGIINAVIETAENNNATEVTEIGIEIGRLAMINPEQLKFMLGVLVENTIVEDAVIKIEEIPVEIECPDCGFKGEADLDDKDHYAPVVECPKCENKRISILNGKDCIVKNIVIEKPDD
ncbi:hydrogenase maturation nickel metallochaperone HypA [uncultured Methanobrevibacter sp.]|uniref:hydrogenase maturation nickel metallochaperone HypA n=1 Tax=uncultured Methanobrevibacter sp. TaxID=253161 RepID=UPI00261BF6C5|nr:hydrogenase maturation nickel metallochaperone HypA [uncultured Methanobrevibacter sp.]